MKRFVAFVFAVVCLAACQKAPFLTMTGSRSFNFTREGGSQTFAFSCNRDWSVSSSESWIRISPSSGTASDGGITVTITCSPNTSYDPRTATITVKVEELAETISVSQETGIGLIVSPTSYDLTNAEQSIEVEVQRNVNYTIEIDNACKDWINKGGTKALSTDKVTFNISANTSYDNREGKIVFKQTVGDLVQTVTIRQSQTNGLFITTPEYDLSNEEHTLSVEVKANIEFDVTPQVDWITFVETKALTPSTVTLKVEANETYDNRTGSVLVKQKKGDLTGTITINQKQTDGLFASPKEIEVEFYSEKVRVEVSHNVDYSVVIPDDSKEWISLLDGPGTKGLVSDHITLEIAENQTAVIRESAITIKQKDGSLCETVSITQNRAPINLSESGNSNCYIVSSSGWYSINALVKGNGKESNETPSSAVVLWESYFANEAIQKGDGIETVNTNNGVLYFKIPLKYQEGNALIATKDSNGRIIWSWHIWVTTYDPQKTYCTYPNSGSIMMDRDLGALSNNPDDDRAIGLFYQWGRKDPFVNNIFAKTYPEDSRSIVESDAIRGTIAYSIENPTSFITCQAHNDGDWLNCHDPSLWGVEKTIYDPCPNGWKIPYSKNDDTSVWYNFISAKDCRLYTNNKGVLFGSYYSIPDTWYRISGEMSEETGEINNYGTTYGAVSFWWSNYVSESSFVYVLDVMNDGTGYVNYCVGKNRAGGNKIRCVKE